MRRPVDGLSDSVRDFPVKSPGAARVAKLIWVLTVGLVLLSGVWSWVNRHVARDDDQTPLIGIAFAIVILAFSTVGLIVAARQSRNPIGWIFLLLGAVMALGAASDGYAAYALLNRPGSLPAGQAAAWVAHFVIDGPGILFGTFIFLFLLFPTGRLPSSRWRLAAWAGVVVVVLLQVLTALSPGPLPGFPGVANPLGVEIVDSLEPVEIVLFLALLALLLSCATSLVLRFRRSDRDQRLQLKWFATAAVVLTVAVATGPLWWISEAELGGLVWPLQFALGLIAIPLACGVAILRYRLYDIDRVVSRAVSYSLLTAVLGGIYLGGVLALAPLVGRGSDLAVAGATLAVAAAFQPLRRRVQAAVDRRFNRSRYDAQQELERFSQRMRDIVEIDHVADDLLQLVDRTLEPSSRTIWVRSGP